MAKNTTITATASESDDVCPKCRGTGWTFEMKDVRKLNPDVWGEIPDKEKKVRLGDKTYERVDGLFIYHYEYAVPCPWCKGVSKAVSDARDTEMPKEYKGFSFDRFDWEIYEEDTTNKQKLIKHFIDNYENLRDRGYGLYINSGTKGSGKTYLACCIANTLIKSYRINAKFVTMVDYLKALSLNKQYSNHDYTDKYYQVELLIMDDFGQSKTSETINKSFYSLIDYRQKRNKPIIFTSNVSISNSEYDDRITSRIDAHSLQITMPEKDIRHKIAQERMQKIYEKAGIR